MFKMSKLSKGCAIALSLSVMSFASGSIMAAECGPGDHWVDSCPAGIDIAPSSGVVTIEIPCGGKSQTMVLRGPTVITRKAGQALSLPHSISTEMTMVLSDGGVPPITLTVGGPDILSTLGQITEVTPTTADSVFDVYFKIDGPFGTLHNNMPHRMMALKGITEVPPLGDWHFPPSSAITTSLYDEDDNEVACLDSKHILPVEGFPDAGVDITPSLGAFQIILTEKMGQKLLGINGCPNVPGCSLVSPLMYDPQTRIGRSDPHADGDKTDEKKGAKVCKKEVDGECVKFFKRPVKDRHFKQVPIDDDGPFDEGPEGTTEIHTRVVSLNMMPCDYDITGAVPPGFVGLGTLDVMKITLSKSKKPRRPSIGEVESLPGDNFLGLPGEGFFNLYVEVDVDLDDDGTSDMTLHNKLPLLLENKLVETLPPPLEFPYNHTKYAAAVYDGNTKIGWIEVASHGVDAYQIEEFCDGVQVPVPPRAVKKFVNNFVKLQKTPLRPLRTPGNSVTLDSFTATASNGEVALEWATGIEKDNAGFFVWRGQSVNGQCSNDPKNYKDVQAITPLVNSKGTEVSGATYTMTDSNVVSGNTYCYALEDRDFAGKSTYHLDNIVSATP
jgi:hypothetical protein